MHKILKIGSSNTELQDILSKELRISKICAQVLINRGINNVEEAEKFLKVKLSHFLDPYSFSDMDKAIKIIQRAAKHKQKVMIFGDYDVDGITALALLKNTLSKMGLDVIHYLPHRIREGYGLNKNILPLAKQKKIGLLITVDCGTSNQQEVRALKNYHIEVIITDHHEPLSLDRQSFASAVINPKLKDSGYRYRDLAGVGVAYKLCQALTAKMLAEDLDLVCLGTIADVVPLTGENRIIAKEGLARLSSSQRPGIRALIEKSGIKDRTITAEFVSYILAPRLNASGRMDTAETALNLLFSDTEDEAEEFAQIIEAHNRQRQKIENKILEEAQDLIDKEINFKEHKIIVLAKEDWHQGVLGIVASKLVDRFYRPTIVISKTANLCRGSGRSIKNFHLFQALLECQDFLETFGGHSHAAGLVINPDNIENFKNNINRLAKEKLCIEDLLPSLDIDMELALSDLNETLIRELEVLEPFGMGNPVPLFYSRNLTRKGEAQLLSRDTLKFWVSDGKVIYPAIGFGMGSFKESLENSDYFDLVYSPRIDNWQEEETILLEVKDIFLNKR
jgi:single-stranded-DNA-specific exonuclease